MRCYSHLSDDEREQIGLAKALGHSIGAIAQAIGHPKSTISRELSRNKLPSGRYSPLHAAGAYQLRRRRAPAIRQRLRPRRRSLARGLRGRLGLPIRRYPAKWGGFHRPLKRPARPSPGRDDADRALDADDASKPSEQPNTCSRPGRSSISSTRPSAATYSVASSRSCSRRRWKIVSPRSAAQVHGRRSSPISTR